MIYCSHLNIQWLHFHLLPCPFKKLTGYDCPGCGFQRSLLALFCGHFADSLHLYPATIPLLLVGFYLVFEQRLRLYRFSYIKAPLYTVTLLIIFGSWIIKLVG